eukprot:jgi/Chlat1/2292/Chrsp17S02591
MDLSKVRVGEATQLAVAAGWQLDKSLRGDKWTTSKFQLNVGYESTLRHFYLNNERLPLDVGARINLQEPDLQRGHVKTWTPELYAQTKWKPNWRHAQPFLGVGARIRMPSDEKFRILPQKYAVIGVQSEYATGWTATLRYADAFDQAPGKLFQTEPTLEVGWGYDL